MFELAYYSNTSGKDFTVVLNESHFSEQPRVMRFLIQKGI
ncbi:hypothetical protein AM1_E0179 (plasmid) [Acaryochloris marina MBIC11017]|uniref:Uncharacterized protein n=1 Tax=Acaryochloris marina (strain MBIC 11017) TaxID=329726 RepID=A8ZPL2_ACAM1|nr:hypothetical protein AM1_E0179 [Acaryochloris marina MBIC11017]